jgi:alpha-1,2-glucosyltransferase
MKALKQYKPILLYLAVISVLAGFFIILKDHALWVDEKGYYAYVAGIIKYHFDLRYIVSQFPKQAALPTYNIFLALIASLIHKSSIADVRLYTFIINLLSIPIFYWAAKQLDQDCALMKTAQYCFLPIIFPFFFLIYTDFMSLLTVLIVLNFVLRKNYLWAGFFGTVCIFVRQNNLMWVAFAYIYLYFRVNGNRFSLSLLIRHLIQGWLFILGAILFVLFVIWNKGILCGHSQRNPLAFYTNNLYFVFFAVFSIFLPVILEKLFQAKKIFQNKTLIIILPLFFVLYMVTFWNNNMINHFNEIKELSFDKGMFFLRNRILSIIFSCTAYKALFFVPIVLTIIALLVTRFYEKSQYLLYPTSFVYLAVLWAVEPRYYFISFVLFNLFRKPGRLAIEMSMLIYFMILSLIFYYFMYRNIFFI